MKGYLVCFKKVEWRVEMWVRVGGLPGEVLRVSGTSVVHYDLIRRRGGGVCGCVWDHVCPCRRGRKGRKEREPPRVVCIMCVCVHAVAGVCVGVGGCGGPCFHLLICSCSRRQDPPWRLFALVNMGRTPPASRCLQFDRRPKTDIHPYSRRALCTAQGSRCVKNMIWYLQKNICKWRPLGCL